jgi:tRNA threonylcarbamoyladenosine biosynthesis protein TsaB
VSSLLPFPHERLLQQGASAGPVLGIDTGGPIATLGVVAAGQISGSLVCSAGSHCANLPDAVEQLLDAAGVGWADLAVVSVAIGPGSFTGLRVGLSYAKAVAAARNIAITGVSSLDGLALCAGKEIPEGCTICPVIDARRGEVYAGLYGLVTDALQRISDVLVVPPADLVARLGDEVVFVGDSMAERVRSLAAANGVRASVVGEAGLHLRGTFVAAIGAVRVVSMEADVIATLEPLYVRPPDAAASAAAVNPGEDIHGTPRGRTHPAANRS